jgi:3-deoxy-D-manno-octulosonic-acid transferase
MYLLSPFFVLHLGWRGIRYAAYWHRWRERFGFVERAGERRIIWVHAVSVGEVRSSAALISRLAGLYPEHRVLVTTMTPTGSEQVRDLFGDAVSHAYVPYDFPGSVRRFIERVRPELAVIAETEFWPNIFRACRLRRIPLVLVNVRLSQASARGYHWVAKTSRAMFSNANLICAQTRADAHRLASLGVSPGLIHVTGNLKFDAPVPQTLIERGRALREQWGRSRPVLIAGSTHKGEERKLLTSFAALRERYPALLLVLVPRHPERFGEVARLCRRAGFRVERRTRQRGPLDAGVQIFVGDTMGELQLLYSAADIAFVGGSLVRRGGQNILEPSAVGLPVVFGPHMFHFEEISAMALERGSGRQVYDVDDLTGTVSVFLDQPQLRRAAGEAARALVAENRGALDKTLALMTDALNWSGARMADSPISADSRQLG